MAIDNERPDPDQLLDKLQKDAEKQSRGRLKIFFGGCAGVGKTYSMLAAAQTLRRQGVDVLVGIIETHGRTETAEKLGGLEELPRLRLRQRDREVTEFDLDGALKRRPGLILVDELAHSNVAGSRHPKRWQDVEELLAAGINVYTTLNVQHLESLNDVVGHITGIRVWETLPDHVFDMADDVTLVDLPADELLARLKEGKVYLAHQAERASKNFFRKGNLIALRELALRRTADRVDAQMREYRADQSIEQVWHAKDRLLACIGPSADADRVVRVAARLAASLKSDWLAVYVETPQLQRLSEARREAVLKHLRLAQELGAETATLSGMDASLVLLGYAKSRNVSKLVLGNPKGPLLWRMLRPTVADDLAANADDVDLYLVSRDKVHPHAPAAHEERPATISLEFEPALREKRRGYAWALLTAILATAAAALLVQHFELANVIMFYLLGVILVSVRYGRGPGVLVSFLSVACFDFFFVPPRMSFSVSDTQYLLTFSVMLTVSLVISRLTSNLRYQARVATHRERRSSALYDLGKELASALTAAQIVEIGTRYLAGVFQAQVAVFLPDSHEAVRLMAAESEEGITLNNADASIAQWVYDHQEQAGLGTNTLPSGSILYLPLKAPMRTRGVLAVCPEQVQQLFLPEQQRLLDTCAAQIALAIERVHYVEVAQDALVSMESERLRNSLLSAISHDVRTPLTVIVGLAGTLQDPLLPETTRRELVVAVHDEALRMNALITNLLDMARLQAGKVQLNKQWHVLEEMLGSALHGMEHSLRDHPVHLQLPADLPLLEVDAVLLERVLCNLLDNVCKYTAATTPIYVSAVVNGKEVWVKIADDGPGLPPGMEVQIFDKFTRGERESAKPGVGLGLSICRAIVEAHGGRIWAHNRAPHGAEFLFALPTGSPPPPPLPEAAPAE